MRYAILENQIVVNIVLWDGETEYLGSENLVLCPDNVCIGWSLIDDTWTDLQEETVENDVGYDILRKSAFSNEADPIFFQYQRGEATKEDWLNKIEEIRNRYLKPID